MQKVEYGTKCKVCGSLPALLEIATAKGIQYACKCPKCPNPIRPMVMRATIGEARGDWDREHGGAVSDAKLAAAMRAMRFLLELDADGGETISNEIVKAEFQHMLDNNFHALFGAAASTMMKMVAARQLKPPPHFVTSQPLKQAPRPQLIVPPTMQKGKR